MSKMAAECGVLGEFPVWALLPRKETGVINLLTKYPTYDGRGTIIAIFDSGVDPAAPGLQVTTDGKVKVLDRIDASGAGDVDTSTVVEPVEGVITGLTGRSLKIPASWVNPSGKYHIGVKGAYSLYPDSLEDRILKQRKDKLWNPHHKLRLAEAQDAFQQKYDKGSHENSTRSGRSDTNGNVTPNGKAKSEGDASTSSMSFLEKLEKDDAEARINLLSILDKKYRDYGPAYDCVVYNDGEVWRTCIDTSECGDLENGVHLGEYLKTHEHTYLTVADKYTVSTNVYNDGNRLEICGMCTSHGTHVASISAANFPDCPERNGVAPGAQIVSITIGDNRLGSMETVTGLVRAMARVMDNPHYKVDLINMSYGEHAHSFKFGRFGDIAHEVVNNYGIIFVGSASNSGPALCTIGTPPDMKSDSIIGVGAYVSPDMMTAEYSMVEKLPGCPYTWSSRGPTVDGARGVTICTPGGAITSVPCFTLRKSQLMNGTSMAAPHATGALALLLSGLKSKNIEYSPYFVRRAIENTALPPEIDVFAQGHGLLQVDKAFEYLCQFAGGVEDKVRIAVECGTGGCKGIHMRNWTADRPLEFHVTVDPIILNELQAEPEEKLAFDMEFVLTCDAPWVKAPPCLQMSYAPRSFKIFLDSAGLKRGHAYMTSVKAYSAKQPEKGHIFEIPITMIVPIIEFTNGCQFSCPAELYRPGTIRRYFLFAPTESTWAKVIIKSKNTNKNMRFSMHAMQLKPLCSMKSLDFYKIYDLVPDEPMTFIVCVKGGYTLELCMAKWWSCLVSGEIEFNVDFHSVFPTEENVSLICSEHVQRVDVRVNFRAEDIMPQAILKHFAQVHPPSEYKVEVLGGARDTIPNARPVYQLVLTYNFQVPKSGLEYTPKCALLNDVLYESPFESQLYMLFDSNKYLLMSGDAYCDKYNVKLDKGDYTIRMHIRHERLDLLEKHCDIPITLYIKLPQEIKLDVYQSYNAAITSGKKVQSLTGHRGRVLPLFIAAPSMTDKGLKGIAVSPGHTLVGTLSFAKDEQVRKSDVYTIRVFLTDQSFRKKGAVSTSDEKKDGKTYSDYQESLRDLQTSWISKLDKESSERLYLEVNESHPDHLPAQVVHLQSIDSEGAQSRDAVIELSKKIISAIDIPALLTFYGTKTDNRPDIIKIRTMMDRQKTWLLESLSKQGLALLGKLNEVAKEERSTEDEEEVSKIVTEILKFIDPNDPKVSGFFLQYYNYHGFYGLACRLIGKQCEEKYSKENEAKLVEVYKNLGWTHVAKMVELAKPIRFPNTYELF